jgi:hypothetical protein
MNVAGPVQGPWQNVAPFTWLSMTTAPGPEFDSDNVAGLSPPVVIELPGGTYPAALLPFDATTWVWNVAVLPPGDVVALFVNVCPAWLDAVVTTMSTDFDAPPLIVPSAHVTVVVPVHPGDADTKASRHSPPLPCVVNEQ